jgi:hypothetical protein
MTKLALHLPINAVSFGQVSTVILRTLFEREMAGKGDLELYIMPVGDNMDLGAQNIDEKFKVWLQNGITRGYHSYSRDIPVFKLWHLQGSMESFGRKQTLLSFYELDNPTRIELNIAKNNNLCFSSNYSINVFKLFGVQSHLLPLAFDTYNFSKLDKTYHTDGRIVFNVCGKFERRKHHAKIIQAWIKKFGGNAKYFLQCATYNPHFSQEQNDDIIRQVVGGVKPFNVAFYPYMRENNIYNDFLNSCDINIGMSGGEGWGLPEFQSAALGKHSVLLNAHSYQTWANDEVACFVEPTGKISAVDGQFFRENHAFNQGQIFDWNEDEFIAACEKAIKRVEISRVNTAGLQLQQTFSKEVFVDNILRLSL